MAAQLPHDEKSALPEDSSVVVGTSAGTRADFYSIERAGEAKMRQAMTLQRHGSRLRYIDKRHDIDKIISFDPSGMLSWLSMLTYQGTIFELSMVRVMLASTAALGVIVFAICVRFPFLDDAEFNTEMFDYLVKFMMTFLAFMVSIFVNGAFNRWQFIVGQLSTLSQTVKMLYLDFVVHNVPRAAIHDVRRWGIASVWLTAQEAPASWTQPKWVDVLAEMGTAGLLTEEEQKLLLAHDNDKPTLVWVWITMKLRQLSEQQFVPARSTPALARMLDHCHNAMAAISQIFNAIVFQVPFQYMHMLALLINLLNIVNTIKCGINLAMLYRQSTGHGGHSAHWPSAMEVQALVANTGIMLLAPLVYQSFLSISADIMIPFGDGSTDIPIHFLIQNLMAELNDFDDGVRSRTAGSAAAAAALPAHGGKD